MSNVKNVRMVASSGPREFVIPGPAQEQREAEARAARIRGRTVAAAARPTSSPAPKPAAMATAPIPARSGVDAAGMSATTRNEVITAAVEAGKIGEHTRAQYLQLWNSQAAEVRHLLTAAPDDGGLPASGLRLSAPALPPSLGRALAATGAVSAVASGRSAPKGSLARALAAVPGGRPELGKRADR